MFIKYDAARLSVKILLTYPHNNQDRIKLIKILILPLNKIYRIPVISSVVNAERKQRSRVDDLISNRGKTSLKNVTGHIS